MVTIKLLTIFKYSIVNIHLDETIQRTQMSLIQIPRSKVNYMVVATVATSNSNQRHLQQNNRQPISTFPVNRHRQLHINTPNIRTFLNCYFIFIITMKMFLPCLLIYRNVYIDPIL